ncbi:shiftless antiviral inhibitor of ribosomal frameshifting protein homolog [Liolophura sinensis]|uniref:shiftless antiviral inhibitor of ribosomal frameshifting protein homolog n=1 Tax=Liolophura sinensis TaxID=3198878 RepID=UPI00315888AF
MASAGTESEENRQQALAVGKLFRGQYEEEEILTLLKKFKFDDDETVKFIMNHEPKEVRDTIYQISLPRSEEAKISSIQEVQIPRSLRQFACEGCDKVWWDRVSNRKPVSKCKTCEERYDPVPTEYEWGVARFRCDCGRSFTGFCQRINSSPCYKCDAQVFPTAILPPSRGQGPRQSKNQHCCDAPNCPHAQPHSRGKIEGRHNKEGSHSSSTDGRKTDIDKPPPKTCLKAKANNVLYPSNIHVSSGSTVASFRPDTD